MFSNLMFSGKSFHNMDVQCVNVQCVNVQCVNTTCKMPNCKQNITFVNCCYWDLQLIGLGTCGFEVDTFPLSHNPP